MGDEAEFHFGKKRPQEGLEFVGGKKRSAFRQKVAHIEDRSRGSASANRLEDRLRAQIRPATPDAPAVPTIPEPSPEAILAPSLAVQAPEAVMPVQQPESDPLAHIYQEPMLTPAVVLTQAEADIELNVKSRDQIPAESFIQLHEDEIKPSRFRKFMAYFFALLAMVLIVLSVLFMLHNVPNISSSLRNKAGFTVYDFASASPFKLDKKSVQIDSHGNLVYFIDNPVSKAHFVVSEQKIPDVVKSDADFQQFLADFDKYAETDSRIGKAYFTHPANIGSDISVVVKTNTTLIFIRGPGTTSEGDWTKLLNHFVVVK